ncbi:NlpC/P60 family protein [Streptomyces sp. NBC_01808]|uniref:NlpC/P60 family protein n=1 Tax=Streptomyces sp. NBC_01808 TaxID=2975947 RepID=UPI002DDAF506|nr:NlpC/P60 family protein [Streptomyces sp. NBC_01808]WSA37336.1 NlpC/P60 family protein [Streptomyces sp. NBC_01808]
MSAHRRSIRHCGAGRLRTGVLTAAAAAALSGSPAVFSGLSDAALAAPDDHAEARERVHDLYAQAERATEKYNAAKERTEELRRKAALLQDRAARDLARINRMRTELGSLAGAQYRSGGIDPNLTLILSESPEGYLEKAATLERIGNRQSGRLRQLVGLQRGLEQQRVRARDTLADLERERDALAGHKREVTDRLAEARRLLNSLPKEERPGAGDRASRSAQAPDLAPVPASGRGALAVAAARGAVGTPYVWGGAAPGGFDCSGLTQWAYGKAGVSIPRTSQAQRYAGRQVPLGQAKPGDLVTYRADASHVAMYVGGGQVVHAPYPGASVRYDPVGMMPVASVTRP